MIDYLNNKSTDGIVLPISNTLTSSLTINRLIDTGVSVLIDTDYQKCSQVFLQQSSFTK